MNMVRYAVFGQSFEYSDDPPVSTFDRSFATAEEAEEHLLSSGCAVGEEGESVYHVVRCEVVAVYVPKLVKVSP